MLIGTTGCQSAFGEQLIRAVAELPRAADRAAALESRRRTPRRAPRTSSSGRDGRAIVATGSPSRDVENRRHAAHHRPGQQRLHLPRRGSGRRRRRGARADRRCLPGRGTDAGRLVPEERAAAGAIYPPISPLRERRPHDRRGDSSPTCATAGYGRQCATSRSRGSSTAPCGGPSTCPTSPADPRSCG